MLTRKRSTRITKVTSSSTSRLTRHPYRLPILLAVLIMGCLMTGSAVFAASLSTDQSEYPLETQAGITGRNFEANETVYIQITYLDGSPLPSGVVSSWGVVANGSGSISTVGGTGTETGTGDGLLGFVTDWTVSSEISPGDTLTVTATGGTSGFTATALLLVSKDFAHQMQNGTNTNTPNWALGAINATNSCYSETRSVPYRYFATELLANSTHYFTITCEATKSTRHALDYLSQYDLSETVALTAVGPCSNDSKSPPGDCAAPVSVASFPDPRLLSSYSVTPPADVYGIINPTFPIDGPGDLYAYNATNVSLGGYYYTGNVGARELNVVITFDVIAAGSVGFFFGGHLAQGHPSGWGVGLGSASIGGAPLHMSPGNLDDASAQPDLAIQNSVVCTPPDMTITCSTGPYCSGSTHTCSVPTGAANYFWTLTGATIVTGQGTASLSYLITAVAGDPVSIEVEACSSNSGCPGDECCGLALHAFTAVDCCDVTITCPSNLTVECDQSTAPAATGTATFTTTGTCPTPITISYVDAETAGACAQEKTISRLWKATDNNGTLRAQCTQTITVDDTTPPVLAGCPADVSAECDAIPAAAVVTATDNCDAAPSVSMAESTTPGSCAENYTLVRTWTATDDCGNIATCTQTITVDDQTPPSVTCPTDIAVDCLADVPPPSIALVTASDNCDASPVVVFVSDVDNGQTCPKTITRTYKATDACGNESICTQIITIDDQEAPVLTCPADVAIECLADVPAPAPGSVSAVDNCDASPVIAFVSDVDNGLSCPKTITRTYQATDACGNVGTCTQTITVDDTTPPTITCPADLTIYCDEPSDPGFTGMAIATDNCTAVGNIVITFSDVNGGGTLTRTFTATDECGNQASCAQTITVGGDLVPPVVTCPDDIAVDCIGDVPPPAPLSLVIVDNCDPMPVAVHVSDVASGTTCPITITRTYQASDASGNTVICTQTITVDDQTPPVLIGCPDNTTAECSSIPTPAVVTATDNCAGVTLDFVETSAPGACPQEETLTRTWTATDACGNQASCSQTITVVDTTPPVVTGCPGDVTVECPGDVPAQNVSLVSATDNCDPAPVVTFLSDVSDGLSCPETITRTYQVTDACDNIAQCTQTITVHDQTLPTLSGCPADLTVECTNVPPPATVTASDNCPGVTLGFMETVGNTGCAQNYTLERVWTATDACGNQAQCVQLVTVRDITPPDISCPADESVACMSDIPAPNSNLVTVSDLCDPAPSVVFVSDVPNGTGCPMTVTRTYKGSDACGNIAFCTQVFTVNDDIPPSITCPNPVTVECMSEVPDPNPTLVTAFDNCDTDPTVIWVSDTPVGSCPTIITRVYQATDDCGNSATCTQIITVDDQTPPQLAGCLADVTVGCGAIPTPANVTATDNCPGVIIDFAEVTDPGSCEHSYTVTRTWTATDACGNQDQCARIITVQDNTPPSIPCPNGVTVNCLADVPTPDPALVDATDDCDDAPVVTHVGDVQSGNGCPITIERTYRAVDACGNAATCVQIITVDDQDPPEITCPADATVDCWADVPDPDVLLVTASDNCGLTPLVEFVGDNLMGTSCPMELHRTYRATDACGNVSSCTQVFILDDQTPPVLTVFPDDQDLVQCEPAEICLDIDGTDNCNGRVTFTVFDGPGAISGLQWCYTPTGTASFDVTIQAEDTCGNVASDIFHVDIRVNSAPQITNCPVDANIHWRDNYVLDLAATDPDLDQSLVFGLCEGAPEGATLNSETGHLEWQSTAQDICDPTFCVFVTDDCGEADTCEFNVCVTNDPPVITCPDNATVCNGDSFATQVTAVDPDAGPYLFYYLESGPSGLTVDANTGAVSWPEPEPGAWEICVTATDSAAVCDPCSPANSDTCCFTLNVVALDLVIEKVHDAIQGQFAHVSIDFMRQGSNWPIAGYDFLIQYDASALVFFEADPGEFFTDCNWEYFTYRFGPSGNCGAGACPSGIVRIVALSETSGGNIANHPDCFTNDGIANPGPNSTTSTQLADLTFFVTNDRTFECQYVPIRFVWYDCGDNGLSNLSGDTLYISNRVFDYAGDVGEPLMPKWNEITGFDMTFPTLTGAPSPDCDLSDKFELVRCANFYNGGVDIICADSIDAPADINLNGIAYEIADAVMFTNYFINGLSAFPQHPVYGAAGSIAATDTNRDGIPLSVADLVQLIRVIIGDCQPYKKATPLTTVNVTFTFQDGVVTLPTDVRFGGASIVVQGYVEPELLISGMDMSYGFDGSVTRIIVTPNLDGSSSSFSGSFVAGLHGELVSIELATNEGLPVLAKNVPQDYRLSQNYPNPFNPTTTLEFALPEVTDYRLTIYNIQGQVVDVHEGRAESAGVYQYEWNAAAHASGVYLYRLDAGSFSQTRKMLLLK